jgi:uncharacterized surface protein with fasciclin (FAS1) repeats
MYGVTTMTTRSLRARFIPTVLAVGLTTPILATGYHAPPTRGDHPATASTVSMAAVAEDTIVDIAAAAGTFKTLLAAAEATDLFDELDGKGPFTVFAPTDEAFGKLPDGTVATLLLEPGRGTLKEILRRHVIAGDVLDSRELIGRRSIRTAGGARVGVEFGFDVFRVGGANVRRPDIMASDGIIHVVDRVILPPNSSIVDLAVGSEALSTLVAAVKAAGLVDTLAGSGPFTVLAPTNDAFAKISSDTLQALLRPENREALTSILALHVIPGRVYAEDGITGATVTTLGGQDVTFSFDNGRLRANGASVVATDIEASNGVVHVIDTVLIPDGFRAPTTRNLVIGIYSTTPDSAIRELLDLDRGQGIGVSSVTRGGGAADAKLQEGDVIIGIDGRIASSEELTAAKRKAGVGGIVELTIIRRVKVEVRADDH